jgi:hypothetical protein
MHGDGWDDQVAPKSPEPCEDAIFVRSFPGRAPAFAWPIKVALRLRQTVGLIDAGGKLNVGRFFRLDLWSVERFWGKPEDFIFEFRLREAIPSECDQHHGPQRRRRSWRCRRSPFPRRWRKTPQSGAVQAVTGSAQRITMTMGKGQLFKTSVPFTKISVTDEKIVDVTPEKKHWSG